MKASIEKTMNRLFGNRSERAAEALIRSAPVQRLLADIDSSEVSRRAALVQRLAAVPGKAASECETLARDAESARNKVKAFQGMLDAAVDEMRLANAAWHARSAFWERERGTVTQELEKSADPRIAAFIANCLAVSNRLHNLEPQYQFTESGKRSHADASLAGAAMVAVSDAITRARALKLQALNEAEVTAALTSLRSGLVQPIAAAAAGLVHELSDIGAADLNEAHALTSAEVST